MVIIDIVINTILGGLILDPAGMHCPSWDDAFGSSWLCSVTVVSVTGTSGSRSVVDLAAVTSRALSALSAV